MIKFFRRIRYDLMGKNKTGKYLQYAIGEILLVIIGILLALSISDWNDKRQLKNNNKVFLKKMLNDLDANVKRLNLLVSDKDSIKNDFPSLEEAIKASDSILELTYLGLNELHINYLMTAQFASGNALLNINDNTYEELKNTGKLYSLGSETLVISITNYYKMAEREASYNIGNSKDVSDGFIKYDDGFGKMMLDFNMDSINFKINEYPFYTDKNSKEYKDFQIGMSLIKSGQNQNMIKMKQIITETIELKKLIKNELQNN